MAELIVSIENPSMMADIKRAIRMIRGVTAVKTSKRSEAPNTTTLKAMEEVKNGEVFRCNTFEDYRSLVADLNNV